MGKITYINKSSCVIKNVKFKGNATIGPNAILCDCEIGDNAKIFCSQIYESQIGDNSKVLPLKQIAKLDLFLISVQAQKSGRLAA